MPTKTDPGCLVCPNHPAEVDPIILMCLLWRQRRPRPVVLEDFYHMRGLRRLFRFVRAIPMPNVESGISAFKRRRITNALDDVHKGVAAGQTILLYPAGRLWRQNREIIGGASALHAVLSEKADTPVILVRTRGLWGSSFSWIFHGERPDVIRLLLRGAWLILANGIFFMPKREVSVTFSTAPDDFPRNASRQDMNAWLEDWYNKPGSEECKTLPYYWWSRRAPSVKGVEKEERVATDDIAKGVRDDVTAFLTQLRDDEKADPIDASMDLRRDVGFDSLEMAEILFWLERRYGAIDIELSEIATVADIMYAAHKGHTTSAERVAEAATAAPRMWQRRRTMYPFSASDTLQETFLTTCNKMGNVPACADEISGALTYRRLKRGSLALALLFQKIQGERIGIMLPSSVAADICIMASLLAGKTPVMINWTLGESTLTHVRNVTGIDTIVTSMRFLDRVDNDGLLSLENTYMLLEDVRRTQVTLGIKLRALFLSLLSPRAQMRRLGIAPTAQDTAILFFTSGSEARPKGVPLTHANILSNIAAVLQKFQFNEKDVVSAILPPFHSFGMTATTLLPLLAGIRVAHYPNPTEARSIVTSAIKWRATLIAGTPTFLKALFATADADVWSHVRFAVTGAEKAPKELYDMVEKDFPHILLREGYGITECSPIVCVGGEHDPPIGVGPPLPDVDVAIVHHETHEPVPEGERGLVLVRGPNVFSGYLDKNDGSPFVTFDAKEWYNTGDLGYREEHGHLVLSGRLKRFVKIGGEMISLPAIEEALFTRWPAKDDGPQIAVTAYEPDEGRPKIIAFTTTKADVKEVNACLKDAGFSNIMRVDRVESIDAIPLLGTGKTDFKRLKEKAKEREEGDS